MNADNYRSKQSKKRHYRDLYATLPLNPTCA